MEGQQIGGYRLLHQIGSGGMGTVWVGEHEKLRRRAAIKILHETLTTRPEIVTRFFNEARAATSISDPGIVQIFDFGQTDGSAYIVMELLEGEPLDARTKRDGALSIGDALRIIRQVASSVGAAHRKGIVHRDLKPENIFIVRDPEVAGGERTKVLDFGIAKLTADTAITNTSAIMGTPLYMSPEQCRGAGKVDQRSDVYSLGCLLFTLIAGRTPFRARGPGDLIVQHITSTPPKLSSHAEGVPREIDELISRCMAKDPAERFASGSELAAAIDEVLSALSPATANRMSAKFEEGDRVTTLGSSVFATPVPSVAKRSNKPFIAIGAVLLTGSAVAAGFFIQRRAADSTRIVEPNIQPPIVEPASIDRRPEQARAGIQSVLKTFVTWSAERAGAPCPTAAELRLDDDPWGHPYEITCTDQPGDQIVGVRSLGPDGKLSDDDLTSWTMGKELTELVRGARWQPRPTEPVEPPVATSEPAKPDPKSTGKRTPTRPKQPPKPPKKPGIVDVDGDGIPDAR